MKAAVSVSVIVSSATTALGVTTQCAAGRVHKDDLTGLLCMTNVNNAASCDSECCKGDVSTCGGVSAKKTIHCGFDEYKAGDDAWAKTPATEDNAKTVCCAKKSTCASAVCPGGYKANTAAAGNLCTGDAKSCATSTDDTWPVNVNSAKCCVIDAGSCLGTSKGGATCNTVYVPKGVGPEKKIQGQFVAGSTKVDDGKWKGTVVAAGQFAKTCCTDMPSCLDTSKYTCPAGRKQKAVGSVLCTDKEGANSLDFKDCGREDKDITAAAKKNKCCEPDKTTCFGLDKALNPNGANVAPAGYYTPKSKWEVKPPIKAPAVAPTPAQYKTSCLEKKSTCSSATCPKGYKKKTGVSALPCPSDVASCVETKTLCCELDAQTCGGQINIACPYGFFNEQANWNADTSDSVKDTWMQKPANATNKNTNCCTARAICDSSATTTPLPTMTPAAPALKYSQHKAITKKKHEEDSSKLLWLASGAIAGMSVMMLVQRMRTSSVRHVPLQDCEIETEVLLDDEQ